MVPNSAVATVWAPNSLRHLPLGKLQTNARRADLADAVVRSKPPTKTGICNHIPMSFNGSLVHPLFRLNLASACEIGFSTSEKERVTAITLSFCIEVTGAIRAASVLLALTRKECCNRSFFQQHESHPGSFFIPPQPT